jgi:hypothetical protein
MDISDSQHNGEFERETNESTDESCIRSPLSTAGSCPTFLFPLCHEFLSSDFSEGWRKCIHGSGGHVYLL